MAQITVEVIGGALQKLTASKIQDVLTQLNLPNHAASVNGDAVEVTYTLSDYEYVTLAPNVKGAAKKAASKNIKTVLKKGSKNK